MRKLVIGLLFFSTVVLAGCNNMDLDNIIDDSKNVLEEPITDSPVVNDELKIGPPFVTEAFIFSTSGTSSYSGGTTYESYATFVENGFIKSTDMPVSTFSADVDTASYSNIRRFLNDDTLPYVDAVRIEEMINYFNYDLPLPSEDEVISITTELSDAPWNNEHQLLMVGLKTEEIDFSETSGNNLVFLLDVSGSMSSPDKLPLLKNAIKLLIGQLRDIDRISIVVYAGAAGVVLDGADGSDRDAIIEAIDALEAGGSTAGGEGIDLAYQVALDNYIEGGNNRVILGTDGDFNVGVSSVDALEDLIVEKRETGIYFSVLGFGTGNLKDDKMETLADKGNGVYYYIDSILEAKKVFVQELGGSLITVAKDVKLQIEFNPLNVKGYRLIGYENRLLDYQDFDNDEIDAGDLGAGHEVIAFYEIIPAGSTEEIDTTEYDIPEDLKYDGSNFSEELMTLSIRYKEPNYDTSELIEKVVMTSDYHTSTSLTFRFSASVVEFGLLLRDSEFKYNSSFEQVIFRATSSKGPDMNGYREEFITLVEIAQTLSQQD